MAGLGGGGAQRQRNWWLGGLGHGWWWGRTEVVVAAAGGGYDLGFGRKKGIVLELWRCGEKIKKKGTFFKRCTWKVWVVRQE